MNALSRWACSAVTRTGAWLLATLVPALIPTAVLALAPSTAQTGQAALPVAQPASISRGQQLVESRCFACHSLDANRVGPALRGVVGRVAGKAEGFDYSQALASATHRWDTSSIKVWLTDPEQLLPGQRMNYRLEEPQDREDVVAYLASLSAAATHVLAPGHGVAVHVGGIE